MTLCGFCIIMYLPTHSPILLFMSSCNSMDQSRIWIYSYIFTLLYIFIYLFRKPEIIYEVGILTKLRAGRFGVRLPVRVKDFFASKTSGQTPEPTQRHVQWLPGSFVGDKTTHLHVSAEVKNECGCNTSPALMALSVTALSSTLYALFKVCEFFKKRCQLNICSVKRLNAYWIIKFIRM